MANKFASIPVPVQSHGNFEFNSMHTTTGDFGRLSVLKCIECVPGDTINFSMDSYIRAAINSQPVNGTINAAAHAFFVRSNLIWSEWDNYIMGLSQATHPYFTWSQAINQKLASDANTQRDMVRYVSGFGLNLNGSTAPQGCSGIKLNALPFRAMQKVWWDYYRDKMRVSDASVSSYLSTTSGNCTNAEVMLLLTPKYRLFPKNYLTSAFDSPAEDGHQSFVSITNQNPNGFSGNQLQDIVTSPSAAMGLKRPNANQTASGVSVSAANPPAVANQGLAPISASTSSIQHQQGASLNFNINQFRAAASFQQRLEIALAAGKNILSRFQALFGTKPLDSQLNLCEHIGGTNSDFTFTNGLATTSMAGTSLDTPFGTAGQNSEQQTAAGTDIPKGTCTLKANLSYHTSVHGYFIVVLSIMPVPQYANNALPAMLTRGTNDFDNNYLSYFTKEFENNGFEPVLFKDVLTPVTYGASTPPPSWAYDPLKVFGWLPKYSSYKFDRDMIGGDYVLDTTRAAFKGRALERDLMCENGYTKYDGTLGTATADIQTTITPENVTKCGHAARTLFDQIFTMGSAEYDHFDINCKFNINMSRNMTENDIPLLDRYDNQHPTERVETGGFRL